MGKLTGKQKIRVLKKKDYILKKLPLPAVNGPRSTAVLSHRELTDYVLLHLPSLYPAAVNESLVGHALFNNTVLVFILVGIDEKASIDKNTHTVVPFLLHPAYFEANTEGSKRIIFQYEDGYDLFVLNEKELVTAEWTKGIYSPGNSNTDDSASNIEREECIYIKTSGTSPVLPQPLKQRPNRYDGNPFLHRRGPGIFRISRFSIYILFIITTAVLSSIYINKTLQAETEKLQKDINVLSSAAVTLTEEAAENKLIIDEYNALTSIERFKPYSILSRIYTVADNARNKSGVRIYITNFRLNKNEFSIEGYTTSGLKILQAFDEYKEDGCFSDVRLSTVRKDTDDTISSRYSGMEGIAISGKWNEENCQPNEGEDL